MSTLPEPALVFSVIAADKTAKAGISVEHVEHASATATIDLLCDAQVPVCEQPVELVLPLCRLLPQDFTGYYHERAYESEEDFRRGRRPRYTQRDLLDWEKNDLRSLLFVHELDPSWEGQVPVVLETGYRVVVLPRDARDEQIVAALVDSDMYKEHCVSEADREAIARVAVEVARAATPGTQTLSLHEWRHMIENYLLNLGCEVQTRHEYRLLVNQLKSAKKSTDGRAASLTVEERIAVWKSCQKSLYRRLHLDWSPDEL